MLTPRIIHREREAFGDGQRLLKQSAPVTAWAALFALAEAQHGVLSLADAARFGISRHAVRRRADREGWRNPHAGVFVLPGVEWGFSQRACAALLAAGPPAALAGWTAAHLHSWIAKPPRRTQVLLPYGRNGRPMVGVFVHRSRRLLPEHLTDIDGFAVTTLERTLCDLAMWASPRQLADFAAKAISDGRTTVERFEEARRMLGPRRGSAGLRAVLARLAQDGSTDSGLERRARALLRRNGFRPVAGTYPVRVEGRLLGIVDIAFPEAKVGVEVDGYLWHRTPAQLARDHRRQNALLAAGWRLVRFSAQDLAAPAEFLAQLSQVLEA